MRTGRRRAATTLGMVLGMALLAGLIVAIVGRPSSPAEPVYTVAQVRAGPARQPGAWTGRTLLVRGIVAESSWATGPTTAVGHACYMPSSRSPISCPLVAPHGATAYLWLIDDSVRSNLNLSSPFFMFHPPNTTTLILTVQPVVPNPLIALARRLPPLARFLPMQGQVPGGVSHLYRIRVRPAGSAPCTSLFPFTCATGVLVDAQP